MGTGKADQNNNNNAEVDNHPEGTRLGHYVLGTFHFTFFVCNYHIYKLELLFCSSFVFVL